MQLKSEGKKQAIMQNRIKQHKQMVGIWNIYVCIYVYTELHGGRHSQHDLNCPTDFVLDWRVVGIHAGWTHFPHSSSIGVSQKS